MRNVAALCLSAGALVAVPAVASAATTVTAGGGTASVQNHGTVQFALEARATQEGVAGAANGMVMIRSSTEGTLRLNVVCMSTDANFSFIEAQDSRTGLYYDVSVIDNATAPDHFAYSGPWGAPPICGGGIAQENSYVTSGNLVVRDG